MVTVVLFTTAVVDELSDDELLSDEPSSVVPLPGVTPGTTPVSILPSVSYFNSKRK